MALETDREKGAHLLRRFGLGASEAELDYYLQDGYKGAVQRLLDYSAVDEGFDLTIEEIAPEDRPAPMPLLVSWWSARLLRTRRPVQEKMTLFWHDHFATSAEKVKAVPVMHRQNEILRANATGSFRTLLHEVSKDPAMIFWLDNQYNVEGKPNENFAREVMELFTLGIGHYSEKDVQEAARCFTGWSIGRRPGARLPNPQRVGAGAQFTFRVGQHDNGAKTVLGKTGNLDGDEVLDLLCDHPRTSEYLATKLWEWFVYPKPEPAVVARIAKVLRQNNLDVRRALEAIMLSSEFTSRKAERAIYKNPVDFVIAAARQVGYSALVESASAVSKRGGLAPTAGVSATLKNMGMSLFFPPDVAGWDGGSSWVSTATMIERMKFADKLFGVSTSRPRMARVPAYPLFAGDPTPEGVVRKLVSIFDAPIAAKKLPALSDAARRAGAANLTPTNANQVAAAVSRVIFAAPEFQFS